MSRIGPPKPPTDISAIFGILYRPNQRAMTTNEMDDAIAEAVAEDDDRIRNAWAAAHPNRSG